MNRAQRRVERRKGRRNFQKLQWKAAIARRPGAQVMIKGEVERMFREVNAETFRAWMMGEPGTIFPTPGQ